MESWELLLSIDIRFLSPICSTVKKNLLKSKEPQSKMPRMFFKQVLIKSTSETFDYYNFTRIVMLLPPTEWLTRTKQTLTLVCVGMPVLFVNLVKIGAGGDWGFPYTIFGRDVLKLIGIDLENILSYARIKPMTNEERCSN